MSKLPTKHPQVYSKWIDVRVVDHTSKTHIYEVVAKQDGLSLGEIKWYGPWRQYAFFPDMDTTWNPECLSDVISFLNQLKEIRKKHVL